MEEWMPAAQRLPTLCQPTPELLQKAARDLSLIFKPQFSALALRNGSSKIAQAR